LFFTSFPAVLWPIFPAADYQWGLTYIPAIRWPIVPAVDWSSDENQHWIKPLVFLCVGDKNKNALHSMQVLLFYLCVRLRCITYLWWFIYIYKIYFEYTLYGAMDIGWQGRCIEWVQVRVGLSSLRKWIKVYDHLGNDVWLLQEPTFRRIVSPPSSGCTSETPMSLCLYKSFKLRSVTSSHPCTLKMEAKRRFL
jgi:hypothetical protein